jgi:hypothetical protein
MLPERRPQHATHNGMMREYGGMESALQYFLHNCIALLYYHRSLVSLDFPRGRHIGVAMMADCRSMMLRRFWQQFPQQFRSIERHRITN